jgi:hypothetical protein
VTTIDSGSRPELGLSELEDKERENQRLRAELEAWKRRYESAKKHEYRQLRRS